MCVVADVVSNFLRINGAAVHVVGIFEVDERRSAIVIDVRADLRLDQIPGENSVGRRTVRGMHPAIADIEASS